MTPTPHTRRSFLRAIGLGALAAPLAFAVAKPSAPLPPTPPREGEIVIHNATLNWVHFHWDGETIWALTADGRCRAYIS